MVSAELMEQTQEFLRATVPGDQSLDAKVRLLIEAEHLRRLAQYRRTDLALARKYGMGFRRIPCPPYLTPKGLQFLRSGCHLAANSFVVFLVRSKPCVRPVLPLLSPCVRIRSS